MANKSMHLGGYSEIVMEPIRNMERCGLLIGGGRHKYMSSTLKKVVKGLL